MTPVALLTRAETADPDVCGSFVLLHILPGCSNLVPMALCGVVFPGWRQSHSCLASLLGHVLLVSWFHESGYDGRNTVMNAFVEILELRFRSAWRRGSEGSLMDTFNLCHEGEYPSCEVNNAVVDISSKL